MDVDLPLDMDPGERADTLARERVYSQKLQHAGKWPHIWRLVGQYSSLSIFDVEDNEELHDILSNLPLFPHMAIEVIALVRHPSDITIAGRG